MVENLMQAPQSGVTVRMYRTGFGDCFLLAFPGREGRPVYMLIDCGVHSQYKDGSEKIHDVIEHLRGSTGGVLDVVAVTHEHADHISGFSQARDVFNAMTINQAWFAWTEKPDDPEAARLKERHAAIRNALAAQQQMAAIDGLLGFFEATTSGSLDVVRKQAKEAKYFKPKCPPVTVPGVDGVRVFVLGPPEDRKALMAANPTGKPGEVYQEEAFAAALLSYANLESPWAETAQPFSGNHRLESDVVQEQQVDPYSFFHRHYGFDKNDAVAWRRIDSDWQSGAEELALKLDSATNNTSLVLAIELPKSKRVLLFPGDAQVGNWASWHDGGWSEKNGLSKGESITAEHLLNRTVLYKVGHHGSHNATLRERGLEMMSSDELAAMIPVDEEWAYRRKPHPWKMPFHPLYEDLLKRTRGRVLRTDVEPHEVPEHPAWLALRHQPRFDKLYVELTIPDE